MKLIRVIIILGLVILTNGNLSSTEEQLFSAKTHTQLHLNKTDSFDNLVNSFEAAILSGDPEVFMEEINEPER